MAKTMSYRDGMKAAFVAMASVRGANAEHIVQAMLHCNVTAADLDNDPAIVRIVKIHEAEDRLMRQGSIDGTGL